MKDNLPVLSGENGTAIKHEYENNNGRHTEMFVPNMRFRKAATGYD